MKYIERILILSKTNEQPDLFRATKPSFCSNLINEKLSIFKLTQNHLIFSIYPSHKHATQSQFIFLKPPKTSNTVLQHSITKYPFNLNNRLRTFAIFPAILFFNYPKRVFPRAAGKEAVTHSICSIFECDLFFFRNNLTNMQVVVGGVVLHEDRAWKDFRISLAIGEEYVVSFTF